MGQGAVEVGIRAQAKADILRRLKCVEGHTRAVGRMLSEGSDSLAVLRQVNALQGALRKIAMLTAQEHFLGLLSSEANDADEDRWERELSEVTGILSTSAGRAEVLG